VKRDLKALSSTSSKGRDLKVNNYSRRPLNTSKLNGASDPLADDEVKPVCEDVVGRGSEQYLLGRLSTIA
jgi:hypothetical protein